jgi:predicted HAD superfamily Cof-like phosphohydrolase
MSRALQVESEAAQKLTNFEKVQHFHASFGQEAPRYMTLDISNPDVEMYRLLELRKKLIVEEFQEVVAELDATHPDINKIAKELADLLYVVYGCGDMLGIPMDDVFEEVHSSNMSKLDENGNPVLREDGKILKSKLYREADIKGVLDKFKSK